MSSRATVVADNSNWFSYVSEGRRCSVPARWERVFNVVSLFVVLYCTWYALWGTVNQHFNTALFAGALMPIIFLTTTRNQRAQRIGVVDCLLAVLSVAVFGYFLANDDFYRNLMQGLTVIPWYEISIGLLAIALTVEASRRSVGWGLTSVLVALLAYSAFGHFLPGAFGHPLVDLPYFITIQTVTTEGLFGPALEVAATYAILFITFGTFFERTGGGEMFFELAAALVGKSKGGGSKACVISSGLYGSISGSPVADVVTTGPLTIPLMKKMGVTSNRAAGIEAAASTGGAMLPPVMGAVAFIMVGYTGLSYTAIAAAAVVPALLYYFGVLYGVHLDSQTIGEGPLAIGKRFNIFGTLLRFWRHLVSILVMITLLMQEFSAGYVAAISVVVLIIVSWTSPRKELRIGLGKLLECSGETVRMIATLTAAVMAAGIIIGCIMLTGLTGKFSIIISAASGGYLAGILLASAVVLIVLGMGMPTVSVYMIGVALIAPIFLVTFKLGMLESHMFILFFSCLSAITPPLAVACFAAASIAQADPMKTGFYACKIGFAGFLIPFFFISHPGLLFDGNPARISWDIATAILLVIGGAWSLFGRGLGIKFGVLTRVAFGILTMALLSTNTTLQTTAGAGIAILALAFLLRNRAEKRAILLQNQQLNMSSEVINSKSPVQS